MTTTTLARHYDVLTPWERLPLLVAAAARGDTVEVGRLIRSAPAEIFQVSSCRALVQGLSHLAHAYLLRQLDRTVLIGSITSLLDQEPLVALKESDARPDDRLWRAVRATACRFVVSAAGWQLFCERLCINPEVPLRDLPGHAAVLQMDELARSLACTPEEMSAWLEEFAQRVAPPASGEADPELSGHVETAEELASEMMAHLESELAAWS